MHQRTRAGLLITLVAAIAGSTFAAPPAVDAVEAGGTYTFLDCDIDIQITRWNPSFEVTDLTAELAEWTTEVSVDLQNPAPAGHGPVKVDLGMMPTGFLPFDVEGTFEYTLELVDSVGAPVMYVGGDDFGLVSDGRWDYDLPDGETVVDLQRGARELRPRGFTFHISGQDEGNSNVSLEATGVCDPLIGARPLLTHYVYDLGAATDLTTSTASPRQGEPLGFTAYHLLAAAPSTPAETVPAALTLGGRPVGSAPVDASGTAAGTFVVPTDLYGAQELRVANGAKVATMTIVLPERPVPSPPSTPGTPSTPTAPEARKALRITETFPSTVGRGQRAVGRIKVSVPRRFTGTVRIYDGKALVGTAAVKKGISAPVTLKRLSRGRHLLTAVWAGSARYPDFKRTLRSFALRQR